MQRPNTQPSFGDSIGGYRVIAEIATGGMGIIYLAAHRTPAGFSQLLAVKELRPEFVQDPSFVHMFLEEGRTAARFRHPNIVDTLETDQDDGRYFITMEYLEGRSFAQIQQRLHPNGGLPLWMSLSIICDVLSALEYVHELPDAIGRPLGFVHRDVSPQNVLVTFDGHTKVIDFGITKSRESVQQTQAGVVKGKLSYMAPEQLVHEASARSDLFSVGAMLFEVVTGRRLWQGKPEVQIFGHLSRGEIPSLQALCPDAPPTLSQICAKALQPVPEDRFASAAHMREALGRYLWTIGPRDQRPSEAIGAEVRGAFGAERDRTRSMVRNYLAELEHGRGGPIQRLALVERERARTRTSARAALPLPAPIRGLFQEDEVIDIELDTIETPANAVITPADAAPRLRWDALGKGLVAAAALALVLGVLIVAWPRRESNRDEVAAPKSVERQPPATRAAPAPASAPVAVPPIVVTAAAPDTILLSVTASPATAQVFIDGDAMPSNPFLSRFPRDATMHRVRVAASGYLAKERLVSFADNVMLDLSLDARREPPPAPVRRAPPMVVRRAPPPPPAPPRAAPPPVEVQVAPVAQPAPAAPDIAPKTTADKPRRRHIESTNPYEGDQ